MSTASAPDASAPDASAPDASVPDSSTGLPRTPPAPVSRLPGVQTTIFTVMSALAAEHGAVNLGQGFPDFDCDPALVSAVDAAMRAGHNQYPAMIGVPRLREAIAGKIEAVGGHRYDPDTDITVHAGATQAIMATILALVHPGDEVIVIEPAYDCYLPSIRLAGGTPVRVPMTPPPAAGGLCTVPWDEVRRAITPRTRALLWNSPHNPTSAAATAADLQALERLALDTGIYIIADEVYEHILFDGRRHESVARYPALVERSVLISSFGKTFHATGWKIGYSCAPRALAAEIRRVHQFMVFTVNSAMQHGIAGYLADPAPWRTLPAFYEARRDHFRRGLARTRFELLDCAGTYFQLVRYAAITDRSGPLDEAAFCQWLVREAGVAAIPVSAFYVQPRESGIIRLCFAKKPETLDLAIERLARL